MVRNIWSLCKPGGRVAGIGSSCMVPPERLEKEKKYNRFFDVDQNYFKQNGTRYTVRMVDDEMKLDLSVVLYWYDKSHYEEVFKKVGFTNFRWVELGLYGDERNEEHWKDFL
jgi:hypothetical protein